MKIDCLALDADELRRHADLLKDRGTRLLAERVETCEMHEHTMALGFDYIQGYYFARPQVHRSRRIQPNTVILRELLARARTCELLADEAGKPNPPRYFTAGLLSALDVILQTDMANALEIVPLVAEQKLALLDRSGDLGAALQTVIRLEAGEPASRLAFWIYRMRSRCAAICAGSPGPTA